MGTSIPFYLETMRYIMARKAKTPDIISTLQTIISPRKLANRIGIKPSRLKKIEQGTEKASKSEISKISHLNKLIPQEEKLKKNIKESKMFDVPKEEVKKARKAKTLKEIEDFNRIVARRKYRHNLTQKILTFEDIHHLTNISKYEYDKRIKSGYIKPDTLRYGVDGFITARNRFNQEVVFVREQWLDGRYPSRYIFMRRDILEAYIEYRKGNTHIPGSDPWLDQNYQIIYQFGVPTTLVA